MFLVMLINSDAVSYVLARPCHQGLGVHGEVTLAWVHGVHVPLCAKFGSTTVQYNFTHGTEVKIDTCFTTFANIIPITVAPDCYQNKFCFVCQLLSLC